MSITKFLLISLIGATSLFLNTVIAETRTDIAPAVQDLLAQGKENSNPCNELLKECFAYSGEEFTSCLLTSGRHPFCENSKLGTLAMKRWSMTPSEADRENAPAFTGPQLVDRECIQNFDSQLSATLSRGEISAQTLTSLEGVLNSCNREAPVELMRP